MDLIAPRIFCIGTHHKTGTVWMRTVFRRLARLFDMPFEMTLTKTAGELIGDAGRQMLVSWTSRFHPSILERPDVRILHMIRDPRDVLLSGMRYHRHATGPGEQFLHIPRAEYGGRTYQEALNAEPDEAARLLFEMRGRHADTLAEMTAWDYARPGTIEVRYEELMRDTRGRAFREHLRDLGLPEPEVELGAQVFWEKSLFGGLADEAKRGDEVRDHIAHGQVAQWRDLLPRAVAEAYAADHGAALVALGYESHPTAWLEEVRHAA